MKKSKILAVLMIISFGTVINANAQDIRHSFGGWLGGGYTSLLNNITQPASGYIFNPSVAGGGGFLGGLGYQFSSGNFLAVTGAEFSYLTSTTKLGELEFLRTWLYTGLQENPNWPMVWDYKFEKYRETQSAGFLQIPLMAGMKFSERYFFLAGGKFGLNLLGNYNAKGNYSTTVIDGMLIDELTEIPNHYIVSSELLGDASLNMADNKILEKGYRGNLKFHTNVMLSAEFGVILDEWILPPPPRRRRGSREPEVRRPTIRASVFVDYGLLNLIRGNETKGEILDYFKTNDIVNTPLDLAVNPLYASNLAKDKTVNSLMAGIKLAVFMPTTAPRPKPQPRPRPERRPPTPRPKPAAKPVPQFYAKVYDLETNVPLEANYQLIDTKTKKEIFGGLTKSYDGLIQNDLKTGNYTLLVNREGYLYYESPVTAVKGDTLLVGLQPIKKEVKVVLKNLFFDVDKWIIKSESQPTLDDLYLFLTDNPTVKIHIVGHTDSSGALKHNMTLSENRAKAVVQWLTKEGISPDRLTYEGKGPNEPIDTNDTPEGKSNNRRVEFVIK